MNLGDREYTLDGTGPFTVTYTDSGRSYIVETNGEITGGEKDETGIAIKLTLTHENKTLNVSELPNVKEVVDYTIILIYPLKLITLICLTFFQL